MQTLSITNNLAGKSILITGTTGFLGNVLLSMLLHDFPQVNKIYILVRASENQTSHERFLEFLQGEVFSPIRERQDLLEQAMKRVEVLNGNVSYPSLGLETEAFRKLQKELDLVIHSAGCVSMTAPFSTVLDVNVKGATHIAELIKTSDHARLLHISTCYIVGNQDGVFKEVSNKKIAPNGKNYEPQEMIEEDNLLIQRIHNNQLTEKATKIELIKLGLEKSRKWGWPNAYAYSKALGENILESMCSPEQLTIFRPTIIESAVSYPVKGWNQGFNTTGPLVYLLGGWYPFFTAKKNLILDLIPVDVTCKAIIAVAAALLSGVHQSHYHCASSADNPLTLDIGLHYARTWHRERLKHEGKSWKEKNLRTYLDIKLIEPTNLLSPFNLRKVTQKLHKLASWFSNKVPSNLMQRLEQQAKQFDTGVRRWSTIYDIFLPYVYTNDFIFEAENLKNLKIEEENYQLDISNLDWESYIKNIHIPGLQRYCFSKIGKEQL